MLALLLGVFPLLGGCQEESPRTQNTATAPLAAPADGELAALRAQIEALQTELEKQRDALRAVDDRLDIRFRAVSDAVTTVAASLRAVSGAVDGLGAQMQAISTSTDDRLSQINTRLATTAATLSGLRGDVDAQQTAIWSLQSDVAAAQATANDAAALAATWPAAVSAWAEGRYVRRLKSWGFWTHYDLPNGQSASNFFTKRRYSLEQIGLDVTGPVDGLLLLDVQYTYSHVTTDRTAALWLCAGGGYAESFWDMPSVYPAYGCTALPNEAVDVSTNHNVKDYRFTTMVPLFSANSFAFQVTGNPAMLRDLPAQPFPVFIDLQPVAWLPDDP